MGLLRPSDGARISQGFGPSSIAVEPSMWYIGTRKAYWTWFPGSAFSNDVHAGVDFIDGGAGTPLRAAERGIVTRSTYDAYNGGGNVVEVEIRDGVRYSYNHCQSRKVGVGQIVKRGQTIATYGATGTIWTGTQFIRSAYGVHNHVVLTFREKGSDGVTRGMMHDFADFMVGGANADAPQIKPSPEVFPKVQVKPGANIRSTPNLDVGDGNVAYVSRANGIFATNGHLVAEQPAQFELRGHWQNDDGGWGRLHKFNRELYVHDGLYG